MKYYFITYQATTIRGRDITIWNKCIDESPMAFIKRNTENDTQYRDFVVLNTLEITEEEFEEYNGEF